MLTQSHFTRKGIFWSSFAEAQFLQLLSCSCIIRLLLSFSLVLFPFCTHFVCLCRSCGATILRYCRCNCRGGSVGRAEEARSIQRHGAVIPRSAGFHVQSSTSPGSTRHDVIGSWRQVVVPSTAVWQQRQGRSGRLARGRQSALHRACTIHAGRTTGGRLDDG